MQTPKEKARSIVSIYDDEINISLHESLKEDIELAIVQRDNAAKKHLAEIRICLNFACYDKTTLERCGDVWQKVFAAEHEFDVGDVQQ